MKRIILLGAFALLTATVPSTPAIAIPDSWAQDLSTQGDPCEFGKTAFVCYFGSRGECQYWLNQSRRADSFGTISRCEPVLDPDAPEGAEWEFFGELF